MNRRVVNKNRLFLFVFMGVVAAMIGATYASVPLYRIFCQVTGFAGTTQLGTIEDMPVATDEEITIRFDGSISSELPWEFGPDDREITVNIGQRALTSYHAINNSDEPIIGQAIYNVSPLRAALYFHKIACFCFDRQRLNPHEEAAMPVIFYVDPEILEDEELEGLNTITLSYTFFRDIDQSWEEDELSLDN